MNELSAGSASTGGGAATAAGAGLTVVTPAATSAIVHNHLPKFGFMSSPLVSRGGDETRRRAIARRQGSACEMVIGRVRDNSE